MEEFGKVADDLHVLSPREFTAARDAAAATARKDGDRTLAAKIKALRKPTLAALCGRWSGRCGRRWPTSGPQERWRRAGVLEESREASTVRSGRRPAAARGEKKRGGGTGRRV
ncbi:hypothetical protein [Kitasatospora griseola]|uniref:hypothetical protein n=1 Tax=Kitasatospora griseola TaxID=2064 RepID=UPI0036661A60